MAELEGSDAQEAVKEDSVQKDHRIAAPGELGVTGLKTSGGLIHEEFLLELRSERGRRVYTEMSSNDPVIAGLLFAIEMPIRESEWRFERHSDNSVDREAEELLNQSMNDMSLSWNDFISQVLTVLVYGFSYFEVVYKRRRGPDAHPQSQYSDGKIGWQKFAFRAQDTIFRWVFDDEGGFRGAIQRTYPDFQDRLIPIEKSVLFRTRTDKGNPEGKSVLRSSYRPWYFKKNLEMMEAIALERMGAGFPVIYLPEQATATDLTNAKDVIRKVRVDEQMGITFPGPKQSATNPNGWLFELVAPASSRGVATGFAEAIVRYRSEILMSVVASFIALGTQAVGSFALSRDQRDFFQTAIEGWMSMISETIDRFATPPLLDVNGLRPTEPVTLAHTPVGQADLRTVSAFLASAGQLNFITPDEATEQWLREIVGAPPKTSEEISEEDRMETEEDTEETDETGEETL